MKRLLARAGGAPTRLDREAAESDGGGNKT